MERNSRETAAPDSREETLVVDEEMLNSRQQSDLMHQCFQYVQQNPSSTNTQLFSFLVLLNGYIPESYLLMSECQKILGPPDPIHGGPPFEERMEPFTPFINTSNPEHICLTDPKFALIAVDKLAGLRISRSTTVKSLMVLLCGNQPQPHTIQFIKDILTKRELRESGKDKFSRLIEDIMDQENFHHAVSVLKTASDKLRQNPIFPQTLSRLYYIRRSDYPRAEEWAKKAIERAPQNSYVADVLGQIQKNHLMRATRLEDILNRAGEAFKAFKDVERKAEKEESPDMRDTGSTASISNTFNNRGLFGFIQVAKIVFEKLRSSEEHRNFIQTLEMGVEAKFDFFEWYLTYSKPDMTTSEPCYFWKDVALCYEHYTRRTAAESISFPGLLDRLNHGLFTSKGRRAGFEETEVTVSDLEAIQDVLKTTYEANVDDVKAAEKYILSNILLSNKMHNSPQLTPVNELQAIIHRFLGTEVGRRRPEFYLLVLLLFWPEEQPLVLQEKDEEEVEQQATEDDGSEDTTQQTWEDDDRDEEQDTRGETSQLSLDFVFGPDLQQQVTFMEQAFERAKYAKYLRGRYLLPLFFLGKGFGLSKWIHKSRLDAIVEEKVTAELADRQEKRMKEKWRLINDMWVNGKVWQVPEIQDILLPVRVCYLTTMPQENKEQRAFVWAGENKICAEEEVVPEASVESPRLFYLGFTIRGPVIFKVRFPPTSGQ
ncbi:sterile alpha motif domain-containing protein 9-like [Dicentrarchus labrax]|uniref:sterile alpha motif domain-containing protein 9-like n=1 Tax=Dicentrarchus labrax TaxID=13489 RepID=UPI0021F574DE|nr:sterile alpha motif domain-containing protein 9-like [Dicentrarchus labrax]XP_051256941.1 sterile alpha motif domain-containing protein 9-like [Dicentrarchus labrax]XP_051256942.1 sterile alpha motif domain-containing protein 9-like [Dicentrarchus labrax]XP_051256943.1 sterile alpha motif domain-containing protein 9-like [Dicentrarchus labrax]